MEESSDGTTSENALPDQSTSFRASFGAGGTGVRRIVSRWCGWSAESPKYRHRAQSIEAAPGETNFSNLGDIV